MPRHAALPMDNGLGHHPAQHTRSRLTRGEGGQLRNKSPGEMGWVRIGGTVTELGRAALADGRWALPTRVDSVKLLAEIDSYAKKTTKTSNKKSGVTSFKGALKAIDKKYRCLEERAPAVSLAQARIEADFIVARRGFATQTTLVGFVSVARVDQIEQVLVAEAGRTVLRAALQTVDHQAMGNAETRFERFGRA